MTRIDIHRYLRHGTAPQLRAFEAAVRLGSLAGAARELHMAQPTVSVQLKKLGETVGTPLLEQIGGRLQPTDAGRAVYQASQALLAVFTQLEESLAQLDIQRAGRLRLAVSTSGMSFVPRLIGAFSRQHPDIVTSVQAHNRQSLVERLGRGEDDLYLFAHDPGLESVVTQELLPNPLVVLARDDHPLAHRRSIPFHELAALPLIVREAGSGVRSIVADLFARHGLKPNIRMELGSNEAVREAILAGLGVAIMARHTYGLDPESDRYICLDFQGFPVENRWYLAYRPGTGRAPALRAFLDFARAHARSLVAAPGA